MTQAKLRALWTLIIWSAVVIVFFPLFFLAGGGVSGYAADSNRIALTAALFASGWIAYFVMLARTRAPRGRVEADERDEQISWRSNGVALTVVVIYMYGLAIALWVVYQEAGVAPTGWMWFLAYSSIFCAYIVHAVTTLILNRRMGAHAEI